VVADLTKYFTLLLLIWIRRLFWKNFGIKFLQSIKDT